MSNGYAQIDRLYGIMANILNSPKTIDVMRKMPAYVKGGEVFSFNNDSFGKTDKPDGDIFKGIERVRKTQAVTAALKRDYTAALKSWIDGEEDTAGDHGSTAPSKKVKDESKVAKPKKVKEDAAETEDGQEFELVAEIKQLLKAGKMKKAKKLLSKYEEHADYEKAYKKIEKAEK